MAFKMNGWSAFTKLTETNPDGTKRSNPEDTPKNTKDMSASKQSSVWSDKATRLVEKRKKKKAEGKSTERVQKRINKELLKLKEKEGRSKYVAQKRAGKIPKKNKDNQDSMVKNDPVVTTKAESPLPKKHGYKK